MREKRHRTIAKMVIVFVKSTARKNGKLRNCENAARATAKAQLQAVTHKMP